MIDWLSHWWMGRLINWFFFSPWMKAGFSSIYPRLWPNLKGLPQGSGISRHLLTHFWVWCRRKKHCLNTSYSQRPRTHQTNDIVTFHGTLYFQKPPPHHFLLGVGFSQSRLRFPSSTKLYLNSAWTLKSLAQIYFLASNDATNTRWQLPHPASFSFLSQRLCSGTSPARGCCWH